MINFFLCLHVTNFVDLSKAKWPINGLTARKLPLITKVQWWDNWMYEWWVERWVSTSLGESRCHWAVSSLTCKYLTYVLTYWHKFRLNGALSHWVDVPVYCRDKVASKDPFQCKLLWSDCIGEQRKSSHLSGLWHGPPQHSSLKLEKYGFHKWTVRLIRKWFGWSYPEVSGQWVRVLMDIINVPQGFILRPVFNVINVV